MSAILPVLISGGVSLAVAIIAFIQWRREVKIKIGELRNEVTSELIRQRVEPYSKFMVKLEPMSSSHGKRIKDNPLLGNDFAKIIQAGIYGSVGILSSHITREILVYARIGCDRFASKSMDYHDWRKRIWAIPWALRSDLGIPQPKWDNEVDRLIQTRSRESNKEETGKGIEELVNALDAWKESETMHEP